MFLTLHTANYARALDKSQISTLDLYSVQGDAREARAQRKQLRLRGTPAAFGIKSKSTKQRVFRVIDDAFDCLALVSNSDAYQAYPTRALEECRVGGEDEKLGTTSSRGTLGLGPNFDVTARHKPQAHSFLSSFLPT